MYKFLFSIVILTVFVSCSKEGNGKTCGLVGEWYCCDLPHFCGSGVWGIERYYIFEEDGDAYYYDDKAHYFNWSTDKDCSEIIITQPNGQVEKLRFEFSEEGELILHEGVYEVYFCKDE
jgi:hypothetical protein